jgi:YHS domain-containing protein
MRKLTFAAFALVLFLGSCGQQNNTESSAAAAPQPATPAAMPESTTAAAPANTTTSATPAATQSGTTAATTKTVPAKTLVWAGDMDPICEMSIDRATVEDTAHYKGKIYGFCNPGCKETFKEDPAKYAKQ